MSTYIDMNYEAPSHLSIQICIGNAFWTCKYHFGDNKHELNEASSNFFPLHVFLGNITHFILKKDAKSRGKT